MHSLWSLTSSLHHKIPWKHPCLECTAPSKPYTLTFHVSRPKAPIKTTCCLFRSLKPQQSIDLPSMATGAGSPCGACKFLRRKCTSDCIFAPYFGSDQSPAQFAAIHRVFGASNVSKLLAQVPVHDRCEAVATIAYEAQARIKDPVYGCVGHIFALQQQVIFLFLVFRYSSDAWLRRTLLTDPSPGIDR